MSCKQNTQGSLCHTCGGYYIGFHSCGITPGYPATGMEVENAVLRQRIAELTAELTAAKQRIAELETTEQP